MRTVNLWLLVSTLLLFFCSALRAMPTFSVCAEEEVNLDLFLKENTTGIPFSWRNSNVNVGLGRVGAGIIPHFTACNATRENSVSVIHYTTTTLDGHTQILEFRLLVYPQPSVVRYTASATVCNGRALDQTIGSLPKGATFKFENDNPNVSLNTISTPEGLNLTAFVTKEMRQTAQITITPQLNGCFGKAEYMKLRVLPTPSVNALEDRVICPNSTNSVLFSGNLAGITFNWTNDNPSVNLALAGAGDLDLGKITNTTGVEQIAHIVVTPQLDGCAGLSKSFKITVRPDPILTTNSFNFCVNDSAHIELKTNLAHDSATSFCWTHNNTNTGLPTAGDAPMIDFQALSNNASAIITAQLVVEATANGCSAATLATVNIKPRPVLYNPGNLFIAAGQRVSVQFTASIEGTNFEWTNSETAMGLPSSGSGNIQFNAPMNTPQNALVSHITSIPSLEGCADQAQMFSITLSPTPSVFTPLATLPNKITVRTNRQEKTGKTAENP